MRVACHGDWCQRGRLYSPASRVAGLKIVVDQPLNISAPASRGRHRAMGVLRTLLTPSLFSSQQLAEARLLPRLQQLTGKLCVYPLLTWLPQPAAKLAASAARRPWLVIGRAREGQADVTCDSRLETYNMPACGLAAKLCTCAHCAWQAGSRQHMWRAGWHVHPGQNIGTKISLFWHAHGVAHPPQSAITDSVHRDVPTCAAQRGAPVRQRRRQGTCAHQPRLCFPADRGF